MDRCMQGGARVHIYAAVADRFGDPVKLVSDGSVQFLTFFDEPLQNPLNIFMKRSLDLAVAVPVVLFLLPPLAVLVWLIHVAQSPGPLFFRQQRYGMNRRAFTIIKFRSMHVQDRNHEAEQARKGDKRVFALGAILRKTSIDEFPQFLNVLRGDMSVVGPRPHLTLHDAEFEKFHERYRARHFVKPGITGLAQIKGFRGEIQNEAAILGRVELDHRYISEWNIGKDLLIIIRTIWQVFFPPKSAY
jgi:undecaprenyl-phosphate glucose phosphotransferase